MEPTTTVLKFGGSVLRTEADLPRVVHEIYCRWRSGEQVLVVVSAFGGTTDRLLARSRQFGDEPHQHATAALVLTGETTSAALLTLSLDRSGIPAKLLSPYQLELLTEGDDPLNAEPISANFARLKNELADAVVVVPGFHGLDSSDDLTLLGRGGTDYTALFLADGLGARCILVKDVDGLYEADPADDGSWARRFRQASYETAISLGGELIQPKAVKFARTRCRSFEIAACGKNDTTLIGDVTDEFAEEQISTRSKLRVALLGCGTVGLGVYERLTALPDLFEIVGVANLHRERAIQRGIREDLIHDNAHALIEKDCDVVIELIGGTEAARQLIQHALRLGRHVITANKALLATDEAELNALAFASGVTLSYSASVGGALPALETARQLSRQRPIAIKGIINGTCNFICGQLEAGLDMSSAIERAQVEGFAEADPTLDVDGTDAAQKLILLARAAFGAELSLSDIDRQGVTCLTPELASEARNNGLAYRLVAECRDSDGRLMASVRPVQLLIKDPLASVRGAQNCLLIETERGHSRVVRGRGAGRYATTESVMADLFDIHRSFRNDSTRSFAPLASAKALGATI